jgi:hypothetical protein
MPIGATNSNWNGMYLTAMSQAKAMIMIVTPSYPNSEWCMKEWLQFQDERRERGTWFLSIAMRFTDSETGPLMDTVSKDAKKFVGSMKSPGGISLNMVGIKVLLLLKVHGIGGLLWHKDDYGISDSHLHTLYETLGDHH